MKIAVRIAQAGNQILNIIVMGIILSRVFFMGYLYECKECIFIR